ncbi:MAG: extracellular solute-binding protein [Epulopiscium sp.]|nr:extracellular solute-binding protein [Candidatus Epulonipiscium sp.]
MKRKLALLLALVLTVMSLAACGSSKTESASDATAPTETQGAAGGNGDSKHLIVAWWGNQTRNERTQAVLDLYSQQNPGITFDGQFVEWNDYWNKLATASAGHSLPDVVQMDYRYLEQYVSNGLLIDLKPYIENGTLDVSGIDESILESGSVDGGIYAISLGVNAPALLYNKTLLDEHGIEIKDNMTMDEFIDKCREIYEKTGYKTNVAYGNGDNFIEYMLRSSGKILFEEGKLGVDSAEELKPFFDIYEIGMKEGWHVDPGIFVERNISVEQEPIVYGSSPETMSWCAFYWSNQLTAVQNAAPEGMEIGITTWPADNPKAANYLRPSQFFSVTVDSKNPEEAVKFLNFFINSVEANNILLGERGVPPVASVAEAITPQLSDQEKLVIDYINNVVTPNSSPINPPAPDSAVEIFDLIDKLEERLCYGEITAAEAAQELFEQGSKIMAGN